MNEKLAELINLYKFNTPLSDFLDMLPSKGFNTNLIGTGYTREVYEVLGQNLVLKIAIKASGIKQNKTECHEAFKKYPEIFNLPLFNNIDYSIIISPKAIAFPEDQEELVYEGLYNLEDDELDCYMANVLEDWEVKRMFERITPFAIKLMEVWLDVHSHPELKCFGLPADYGKSCSYGTVEDQVKIIDFGLTDFTYL